LNKSKKITQVSGAVLALIIAVIGVTPLTGGLSNLALAPIVAATGLEIAAIITAASIGLGLIIALFKEHEKIEVSNGKPIVKKRKKTITL